MNINIGIDIHKVNKYFNIKIKSKIYKLIYALLIIILVGSNASKTLCADLDERSNYRDRSSIICEKVCSPVYTTNQEIVDAAAPNAPIHNNSSICTPTRSIFIPRSQGSDTARQLIGWQSLLWGYNAINNVVFNQVLEFSRSYSPDLINYYLFNRSERLNFLGSQLPDHNKLDLLADYFGLSPEFNGNLWLDPRIENIYFDNQLFFRLNDISCGLWGQIFLPIVHTRWSLGLQQEVFENSGDFPIGYMGEDQAKPYDTLAQALNNPTLYGSLIEPLKYGKFDFDTRTLTRLANVDLILGYNTIQTPYYHFGLYLQLTCPTGNKPDPKYLFNPIVGNAKHWELGAGLTAHRIIYGFDSQGYISLYLQGNVTHMFDNNQLRSFDLKGQGALSRYMLLKEFDSDGITATGRFIPAINLTTRAIRSTIDVKADFTLKLAYNDPCGLEIDLGYNIYGNQAEKIRFCNDNVDKDLSRYGIKGTQGTNYLIYDTKTLPNSQEVLNELLEVPVLDSTESNAKITSSGSIDNPEAINLDPNEIAITWNSAKSGSINSPEVIGAKTSNPSVLLPRNINHALECNSGAAAGSLTHAVFFYANYIEQDFLNCGYIGNIGLGAKVEFQGYVATDRIATNNQVIQAEIINRLLSNLNQWCLYLKGGISF